MACPREDRERDELALVCERGVRAVDTRGRERPESECEIRTVSYTHLTLPTICSV